MALVRHPYVCGWVDTLQPQLVGVYAWASRLIEDHQVPNSDAPYVTSGEGVLRSFAGRFYWRPPLDQPMAMVVPDAYVRHVVGRAGPLHWSYADIKDVVAMAHDIVLCTQAPAIVAAEKSP